jgi:hypothetical protein
VPTEEDFEVADLGPEAPPFRPATGIGQIRIKNINNATSRCEDPAGTRGDAMKALAATLRHEPRSAWARRWSGLQQEGDVRKILDLCLTLRGMREHRESSNINGWLTAKFPDNPAVRLMQAGPLVNVRQWPDVIELLSPVNSRALDEGDAQHLHHLLGLAFLNLGEADEAQRLFERGMAIQGGRCDLGMLLALATPLAASAAEPEPAWAAEQLAVRDLFAAIEAADRCLTRTDAAAAIIALDRLVVTETGEVQSLARRAEAYLLDDDAAGQSLFEKACALAWFCAAHGEKKAQLRRELPIPRGRWDTARLDDLLKRATRWLDTTLGDAWPLPGGGL